MNISRIFRKSIITTVLALGSFLMGMSALPAHAQCGDDPGNDDLASATALSGCGTTSAAVDCIGDYDYYGLTAPTSGAYVFETTGTTDTFIELYDTNGSVIANDDDSGSGTNGRIEYTLTEGQRYYVSVHEYNNDATGDYTLVISGCSACGDDPGNDTMATSTAFGSCGTKTAGIDCADDIDIYNFQVPTSGDYTFSASAINGTIVSVGTGSNWVNSGGSSISRTYSAGTTVYVKVEPDTAGQTFEYDLTISGCDTACGNDPGNNTLADATPLSGCGTTSAAIDCVGDLDYYWLNAPNSGSFTFETTGSLDTELRLYDANGDAIASDDDSGTGSNASISYTLVSGQKYSIAVNEYGNNATGDYALVISGCSGGGCGNDPDNDTLADATPLSGCGTTSAAIDCAGDLDYYWLTAPNSGVFTFETTGSTDTEMRLYDANGDAIASDDDSGDGSNARIIHNTVVAGQKYSIAVNEFGNNDTGDYALVISGCDGGGCGDDPDNDTMATSTAFGSCGTKTAGIDCADDIDIYNFQVPTSGEYTFSASAINGTIVSVGTGSNWVDSGGSSISRTYSAGTTVYVKVEPDTAGQTFEYDLTISGCTGGGCGNDPGNDTLADATPLSGCGTTSAAIDCAGDLDYYWLTAPNSGSFTFETTGSIDTELRLYDANGDAIASDDDSGTDHNARIVYTLTAGAKYSVAVNEYGNDGTGAYDLVISGCSSGTCGNDPGNDNYQAATNLGSSCGTTSAAIDCAGDIDFYSFTAPSTGNFTFDVSATHSYTIALYDNTLGLLEGPNGSALSHSLSANEQILVRVWEGTSSATFNYDLTISGCTGGGCGNDPGNDTLADATPLSGCGTTTAAIDCAGDLDYYWLTAPNSGSFTFATTGSTDTELRLYDSNGAEIDSDDDSGNNTNAWISHTLVGGQTYIVAVNEYNNDDTGSYALEIAGCGQQSCGNDPGNDSFASATAVQGCGTTSAAIDCGTDQDYYQFNPADSGSYTFTIQVSFNALIELYDASHTLLGQDAYQIIHDLQPSSGPYFIAVVSALDLTGDYDLTISGCNSGGGGCAGDTDGDTSQAATTLPGCGSTSAAFDCSGDVDYFKLIPTTSGAYAFETTGSMDARIWLEDAQGNTLDFDDDSGQGANARIEWNLSSGMQYFIRVEEYNNDDTGSYGLTVTGCNAASCGQDGEGDTIGTAVSLSTCGITDAAFDCSDDVDVYRFEAPLSVPFNFETTGGLDTFIQLLDGNGNPLDSDDDSGSGTNASVSRSMTAGESVYLEVTETGGNQGAYSIEIDGCDATGEPPNQYTYIITSVAKVAGSAGTNWVSDLAILNVGDGTGDITISRWERDRTNTNPQQVHRTLGAGEMERSADVLESLFGLPNGAAALHILSDQPLIIGSRTYNQLEGKTYGQFIPGVASHEAIPAGEDVILSGLAENDAFRTNLGLVNPGDAEIEVTGVFFDANSNSLGSKNWTVPAHGYIQRNRVVREVTGQAITEVWMRLSTNSGEFFSFLSIVDQQSGDPVYRPGMTAPTASGDVLIPGVAKLAGAAGTNWVTDTVFTNTTQADSSVKVSLWKRDQNNSSPTQRSFLLKPERMVELSDVLLSLFGETAGAATLDVTVGAGILADGRTYNQVKQGTYGQYIPGLGEGQAVTNHRRGFLVMAAQNAAFRANLGLVNPSMTAVDVEVRLYGASGTQVGSSRTWNLGGRTVKQIDRIVRQFTNQDMDSGWIEIRVKDSTPDGQVLIFNSVVDQVSGDPIFETVTLAP